MRRMKTVCGQDCGNDLAGGMEHRGKCSRQRKPQTGQLQGSSSLGESWKEERACVTRRLLDFPHTRAATNVFMSSQH